MGKNTRRAKAASTTAEAEENKEKDGDAHTEREIYAQRQGFLEEMRNIRHLQQQQTQRELGKLSEILNSF